jgi:peptide/nickel transport system permease protein
MTAIVDGSAARNSPHLNLTVARYLQAFRSPRGIFAIVVILGLTALAFLAPAIFPGGYDEQTRDSLLPMSFTHLFGTDELGRDIFVRSIFGLRTDLTLVYIAVPISMVIGTLLGLIGYVSRWAGTVIQRMFDVIVGFPGLILGISIVLVLGSGFTALLVSIIIIGLPTFGRLARASLLAQEQREYVIAARTLGISRPRVMVRHILPNALDAIIVQGAVFVVHAIFFEASLSIVGLGIQPPAPSLGSLLNVGMQYITQSSTYILGPTVILLLLAFALSLLADALNETVNRK